MKDSPFPTEHSSLRSYDNALGQRIIALHRWAVEEGLRGTQAHRLLEGFFRRLGASMPLWRGFAGMNTLHPQWGGYAYTWRRDLDAIEPVQYERCEAYEQDLSESPFGAMLREGRTARRGPPPFRRRLAGPEARLDFHILEQLAAEGATDYYAQLLPFGAGGERSRGFGIGYSFATDCADGFTADDLSLIQAVLPAVSLAMMSEASHMIASGLLAAYLGADAGARVHAGAVERGSVESIRAVLWYADIRGFTALAEAWPGRTVVQLLDEVFETIVAPLRSRGGHVLKFIGDGLLATFRFEAADPAEVCRRAFDAAVEANAGLARLNAARQEAGKPAAIVDLALHVGEVLYGNIGAVDRVDFTVIGPAVNEVARLEPLCEPLGRNVLVSAEFAAALGDTRRLTSLGRHPLRGVREPREIFGLDIAG